MQILAGVEQAWDKEKNVRHFRSWMDKNSPAMQFYVADNNVTSHSRAHLEQMMKDLIGEAERWDPGAEPCCKFMVDKFLYLREEDGPYDWHQNGTSQNRFRRIL